MYSKKFKSIDGKTYTINIRFDNCIYYASINKNNILKQGIGITEKGAIENLLSQI